MAKEGKKIHTAFLTGSSNAVMQVATLIESVLNDHGISCMSPVTGSLKIISQSFIYP